MHHYANGRFDWLSSEHRSVNPSREAISILSEKYVRFTFIYPANRSAIQILSGDFPIILDNQASSSKVLVNSSEYYFH